MSDERVAIFIDGSNLYHCLKTSLPSVRLDYAKLIVKLVAGRRLLRTYYYNAPIDQQRDPIGYQGQQKFFAALKHIPYLELKLGRLEVRPGNQYVEKGVDIALAVDMLTLAYRNVYDTAILVSGDGDFAHVVLAVKDLGKHVENLCLDSGQSRALRDACDRSILLDAVFAQDIQF